MAPQRQLRTVSQLVVALGILACLVFAVIYSGRIVAGVQAREQLAEMQQQVEGQRQFQQQVKSWITESDDAPAVEAFARDQLNWGLAGESQVVALNAAPSAPAVAAPAPAASDAPAAAEAPSLPNWRLWWNLIAAPAEPVGAN